MGDICLEFPDYPRIPEICVKMIRRINDEEGIRKLVMDVFQNMWFQTLQPYLNVRCKTQGDYQIISHVARTLELTVPLIEHPSEIFLSQLEEASMKLILLHDKPVVSACLSCLGSVVNNVTRNFTLIRDCFKKYFGHLVSFKKVHSNDPQDQRLEKATPFFRRSLFTVGLLLRYFDFGKEELYAGLEWGSETKNAVFDALYYFLDHENVHIQNA